MSTRQILCYEKCAGGNYPKKGTVLVIASMAGKKLPPPVIGKSANPRSASKTSKKPPLSYEHNTKAWMTSTIFEKWVKKLDLQMKKSQRKIALVLDNCTAHPNVSGLTNIMLVFLPPNTTGKIQ